MDELAYRSRAERDECHQEHDRDDTLATPTRPSSWTIVNIHGSPFTGYRIASGT
jgi:hypothetical protein